MSTTDQKHGVDGDLAGILAAGKHLIGRNWMGAASGRSLDVIDPATGGAFAQVPDGAAADVDAAVREAASAFPAWRDHNPTHRAGLLYRWGALCNEWAAEINRLECREVGQPYQAPSSVGARIIYVAGQADKITGDSLPTVGPDLIALTRREPFGVCGCIVPWNAPTALMIAVVAPALAAGNTVVVKPSAEAPLACLLIGALALEAGLPPGVLNLVTGAGRTAGAALAAHPGIRHMSFTGSSETGRQVMKACADRLVPLHLELGGKSPQVVFADADLDLAIPNIVRGIALNSGQTCAAGTRVLVERRSHAEVVERLAQGMSRITLGAWNQQADMGPLISAAQERQVLGHIADARAAGAALVVGGGRPASIDGDQGYYVEPTLFDGVEPEMRIAQEEVFGPVLSVLEFETMDEALEIANGTPYGLAATAWTSDVGRAVRMARRLEAGQVHVNVGRPGGAVGAPFGGFKQSGFGRTMGVDTINEFTQSKTLVIGGHIANGGTDVG